MSKIGKRAMLLLLALPIGFNVMAQETKKADTGRTDSGRRELPLCRKTCTDCNGGVTNASNRGIDTLIRFNPKTGKERNPVHP